MIGIVPAAGHARRLQPLDGSKEVIPVGGKPVMVYLVERMRIAGCSDIRVVTRPEKNDVALNAERLGVAVVHAHPQSVAESVLAGMAGVASDDVVIFGFPDTIWEPRDGFVQALAALGGYDVALGLFRGREPQRSDVVTFLDSGVVTRVDVKPVEPTSEWVWGFAAARAEVLRGLQGRDEPGDYFNSLCESRRVVGVPLSGPFIDIGTRAALREALATVSPA